MIRTEFREVLTILVVAAAFSVAACDTSESDAPSDTSTDIASETTSDATSEPMCAEVAEFV